ncbi:MAG: arsenic efflux protein [Clostridia bacterium]|nr:arsenic efflux protein [Clostridia bacterium]
MNWETFFDILLDALKDSAIIFPFLLVAYVLIEVLEVYSAKNIEQNRLLTGKFSTLFAASFGLIPQCGFSVVATDLFSQRKIKVGALLAVYIATSDEAVPLLLTSTNNPSKMLALLPLLLIKFVLAIAVGYFIDSIIASKNQKQIIFNVDQITNQSADQPIESKTQNEETSEKSVPLAANENFEAIQDDESHKKHHHHGDHDEHAHEETHHHGCCGHDIEGEKVSPWKQFLLHPLIHSLKIFAFVLAVNLVMGIIIGFIGEDALSNALTTGKWFAPLIACLIGAIPNCASSVVITRLYILGGIGFGALTAGLIVNAGLGFVILFKQNKNIKQNFTLLGIMLALGLIVGYVIQLIGF